MGAGDMGAVVSLLARHCLSVGLLGLGWVAALPVAQATSTPGTLDAQQRPVFRRWLVCIVQGLLAQGPTLDILAPGIAKLLAVLSGKKDWTSWSKE